MAGTLRLLAFFAPVLLAQAWPIQENNNSTTKQYIVALKANLDADSHIQWVSDVHSRSLGRRDTAGVTNRHRIGDVHFYTGEFNEDTVAQIDRHSDVDIIEEDQTDIAHDYVQWNAPWNLAQLSAFSSKWRGNPWELKHKYTYDGIAGEGVVVYVMDSGIQENHPDLAGRVIKAYNYWHKFESDDDNSGHGTHVAGIIVSRTYGVAKKAIVVDVKVANKMGHVTADSVISGLSFIMQQARHIGPFGISMDLVNFSGGVLPSKAVDIAFRAAHRAGMVCVVAAGDDASLVRTSPQIEHTTVVVGSVDWKQEISRFSNYGPKVDIFAPGDHIRSLSIRQGYDSIMSGTAMAAPHISGIIAMLKAARYLDWPDMTVTRLRELARKGAITMNRHHLDSNTINVLAYHGGAT
ncbi:subtilisin-like protein [Corynespora cassiicola Philippines]|uniref:Subtilisin-like protein n=1 Tax=Corynespora cassiicola Philippines TaxID=1448308 RepID=A0A2T2NR38_CORCC|nr:subtilisin-like protein [Corynespora cassiicola Philippines]